MAITITLMFFAAIGFVGAGIALAVARAHEMHEDEMDLGMRAVMVLLSGFGTACMLVAAGFLGVLAFGGVVGWVSYVLAARRLDVFRIEPASLRREEAVEA